jgi:hypothetical protein
MFVGEPRPKRVILVRMIEVASTGLEVRKSYTLSQYSPIEHEKKVSKAIILLVMLCLLSKRYL